MDHYSFNMNRSIKLNIIGYASTNSEIQTNNDPIPLLFKDYTEIKSFFELKNITKVLYFNIKSIHKILYEYDQIIQINDNMPNDLAFTFYLILLIKSEEDLINYEYNINYINNYIKKNNNKENKYLNIINIKIILELIINLRKCNSFEEKKFR